ncbi:MAG TPA: 23S rRNA (pseudouridine(1915)-N(3))-methyltransferase RlmH [Steroidobacteraceae bacterium]|nr:23S rRNA (pseudouridine(1915)-N(3))-methyltransferase RlmH [Steroidobacteraceae bacterium]
MRILAVGERMPRWVDDVVADYARRLPPHLKLAVSAVPAGHRGSGGGTQAVQQEGQRLLAALRTDEYPVALDEHGRQFSTLQFSAWLGGRLQQGRDLAFLIGGPDGLAPTVLERCELEWSLSPLTLPHALVRAVLAEQLYRAHTVLCGHPYHRE